MLLLRLWEFYFQLIFVFFLCSDRSSELELQGTSRRDNSSHFMQFLGNAFFNLSIDADRLLILIEIVHHILPVS